MNATYSLLLKHHVQSSTKDGINVFKIHCGGGGDISHMPPSEIPLGRKEERR